MWEYNNGFMTTCRNVWSLLTQLHMQEKNGSEEMIYAFLPKCILSKILLASAKHSSGSLKTLNTICLGKSILALYTRICKSACLLSGSETTAVVGVPEFIRPEKLLEMLDAREGFVVGMMIGGG